MYLVIILFIVYWLVKRKFSSRKVTTTTTTTTWIELMVGKRCSLEKCSKFNMDTGKHMEDKYIAWTNNFSVAPVDPLRNKKDKIGVSTCGAIYFYDKSNHALCLKEGRILEYYRNANRFYFDGRDIMEVIREKLLPRHLRTFDEAIKFSDDHIKNYWVTKDTIDIHILPPVDGLKHIQLNFKKGTMAKYYDGTTVRLNSTKLEQQFAISHEYDGENVQRITPLNRSNIYKEEKTIEFWRRILGPGLHHHCGDFTRHHDHRAFRDQVRNLYPFIGYHKKILDVGCGWGGPANLLRSDLHSKVTCVTPSVQQLLFCQDMGFPVYFGDVAKTALYGSYDFCVCIESFNHISEKRVFLERVKLFCKTLIMLVNCDVSETKERLGMEVYTPSRLKEAIVDAGWIIQHFKNTRGDNLSNRYWERNMKNMSDEDGNYVTALRTTNKSGVVLVVASLNTRVSKYVIQPETFGEEYTTMFERMGVDVKVFDYCEFILENLREITSYMNNECLEKHPLEYGSTTTFGKMMYDEHPSCVDEYVKRFRTGPSYLVSFNRSEGGYKGPFIDLHKDSTYDTDRTLKFTCIACVSAILPPGGELYVNVNNKTVTIPSKTGRVIQFGPHVSYGTRPFDSKYTRSTVAFAQYL